jgi:hypothetical protein
MSDDDDGYNLQWSDHVNEVFTVLRRLRSKDRLADVSIFCSNDSSSTENGVETGGEHFRAHKVVLAACSSFFENLFLSANDNRSNAVLVMTDVSSTMFRLVLDFMYDGEVYVEATDLEKFMETAKKLGIRGLQPEPEHTAAPDEEEVLPSSPAENRGEKTNDDVVEVGRRQPTPSRRRNRSATSPEASNKRSRRDSGENAAYIVEEPEEQERASSAASSVQIINTPRPVPTSSAPGALKYVLSDSNSAGKENSDRSQLISLEQAVQELVGAHESMVRHFSLFSVILSVNPSVFPSFIACLKYKL